MMASALSAWSSTRMLAGLPADDTVRTGFHTMEPPGGSIAGSTNSVSDTSEPSRDWGQGVQEGDAPREARADATEGDAGPMRARSDAPVLAAAAMTESAVARSRTQVETGRSPAVEPFAGAAGPLRARRTRSWRTYDRVALVTTTCSCTTREHEGPLAGAHSCETATAKGSEGAERTRLRALHEEWAGEDSMTLRLEECKHS